MLILDIVFYSFIAIVCIQVVFYAILFGNFAFNKITTKERKHHSVSLIICAKNEAKNLKSFLPSIIKQDYPDFEIVLINDASSDDTLDIMEAFAEQHNNIKIVNVKNIEAFWGNKKYALTLGIKAAKHEHLLFTDADCKPVTNQWIKSMISNFSNTTTIILGYGPYTKAKYSLLNKLIRYETLLTAIQYFSFAKIGIPYMGVGRNLAYNRSEFYKTNGFIKHMDIRSGDDDLFINEAANSKNTSICIQPNSFTYSVPKSTFKDWFIQKRRHVSTANNYKFIHKSLLTLFYSTQLLFWTLAIILLITLFHWKIVTVLIITRFIIQYLVTGFAAKKLNEIDLLFLLPFLELFLIVSQLTIFISNLISKPKYWK